MEAFLRVLDGTAVIAWLLTAGFLIGYMARTGMCMLKKRKREKRSEQ